MVRSSKRSRRRSYGTKKTTGKKDGDKNLWSPKTKQRRRLLAKKEIIDARLAAIDEEQREPEPEEDDLERDEYENRVVIKFFWKQLGSPTDPEEWKQRDGVTEQRCYSRHYIRFRYRFWRLHLQIHPRPWQRREKQRDGVTDSCSPRSLQAY